MKYLKYFLIIIIFSLGSFSFVGAQVKCADGGMLVPTEEDCPKTDVKQIQLTNPLGDTDDLPTLVQKILEIALKIGVPLIALAIIYTGYLFIAAQGNPEKLQKAKQSLVWVVVGSGILLGAYVIAEALVGTINAIRGN